MDQGTNTRDHEQEQSAELVYQERSLYIQPSGFDEIKIANHHGGCAGCSHFPEHQETDNKRGNQYTTANDVHEHP